MRDDGVERAEVVGPGRLAEVARYERHATRELAEVLGRELVHRLGPVERDVTLNVAVAEDRERKLAGARAELEDPQLRPRRQCGAIRCEEARPEWLLDLR